MSKPKKVEYSLKEQIQKIKEAGFSHENTSSVTTELEDLSERIKNVLKIFKDKPIKATDMTFLVMYDIEDDRVRTRIAKYLEKNGLIRIQKSIFIANKPIPFFDDLFKTLEEIQAYYENHDSILLVPVNTSELKSMKIIGKEITIQTLIDKPNTLFF